MNTFTAIVAVRWADVDANRHVRHSAYYDYGAHARIQFFETIRFGDSVMQELHIGPIIFKEECSFIREIRLNDKLIVNILRGETMHPNAARWVLHHEIYNQHKQKCAHISLSGAWMNLQKRKLTKPPAGLATAFKELPIGQAYEYKKRQ